MSLGLGAACSPSQSPSSGSLVAPPAAPPREVPAECAPTPSAVPILPRSSNDEVRQLASDLLGAPLDPGLFVRWTPLAQVRGFDTMTESRIDAQTLEEQLRTTEAIAALLVASPSVMAVCPAPPAPAPVCAVHPSYDGTSQFSSVQEQDCWSYVGGDGAPLSFDTGAQRWNSPTDPGLFVWANGLHPGIGTDAIRRWRAPLTGAVTVRGMFADADPGGGDGVAVSLRGPSGALWGATILNGGAAEQFEATLDVDQGDTLELVVERRANNSWDSTALNVTVELVAAPPSRFFTWETCGERVVSKLAARAYRRPLRAEELADLRTVFEEVRASAVNELAAVDAFSPALEAALQAMLMSPHVLYKPEFVPGGFAEEERLFRRASRLALYFLSSFPDDELWALAEAGGLDDEPSMRAQAERLLASSARARFVDNFAGQWLNFRPLLGASATPLETSMRREGHDVFSAILAQHDPPKRLLAPGFSIVDGPLAAHYGLSGVDPTSTTPVMVTTDERGGLFTQGHFLTAGASGSEFRRVIHRGIYALNRTLCTSVPQLDPATLEEISASVGAIDPSLPLGERMQQHRQSGARCIGCHGMMDPLGLALERFDAQGRWRDTYPDGSAITNDFDYFGTSVRDPRELSEFVAESDAFRQCVASKLVTFGLHREPRSDEQCAIEALSGTPEAPRSLHDLAIDAFLLALRLTEMP